MEAALASAMSAILRGRLARARPEQAFPARYPVALSLATCDSRATGPQPQGCGWRGQQFATCFAAHRVGQVSFINNLSCLYPTYIRGEGYLAAGQSMPAAAEFQKILDHSGIVWNCWTGALAHLGVARANALQAKTSQGADADAARAPRPRCLQVFPDALEGCRPRHSGLQTSQSRVHQAAIAEDLASDARCGCAWMTASNPLILMFMHISTAPSGLQISPFVDRRACRTLSRNGLRGAFGFTLPPIRLWPSIVESPFRASLLICP